MDQTISLHKEWSTGRKLRFRFISLFFFLYIFPFPLYLIPIPEIGRAVADFWAAITQWFGISILGIEEIVAGSPGSGDKTSDWLRLGIMAILSILIGILWSIIDRKRKSYQRLWRWFQMLLVYYVASVMFSYGLAKVFGEQFGYPSIARMMETYGESSPMRLMWTFMSASEPYEQFSGWAEAIAGFLILFRRTRTLGGLAVAGVMLNVFMMNMTYDVPVKQFSGLLMLMGIYIALADHKRLLSVFISNKPVGAIEWPPFFQTFWKRLVLAIVQLAIAAYIIIDPITSGLELEKNFNPDRPRPALYGIHDVEHFVVNGDTLPPLTTDTLRWSKAYMDLPGFGGNQFFGIKDMQNRSRTLRAEIDSVQNLLTLRPFRDTVNVYELAYEFIDGNLHLNGVFEGDTLQISTTYFNPDDFILRSRGFNWINEVPYNRGVPYRQ